MNKDTLQYNKSSRAWWIEYNEGVYFITVCTKNHRNFFGEIYDGVMHLSPIGEFLNRELSEVRNRYDYIEIPLYVVMPNHFHVILYVGEPDDKNVERLPTRTFISKKYGSRSLPLVSEYIGRLKAAVSRYAHPRCPEFSWQPRFYDHAIRGNSDANRISEYILNNVTRWDADRFYSHT